jgi:hypothetical protein
MKTIIIFLLTFLNCSESFSQFGGIVGCKTFKTTEKSSDTYINGYVGVASYLLAGATWASMNLNMTIPSKIEISNKSATLSGYDSQVTTGMTFILDRIINLKPSIDTTKKKFWKIFPFMGFNYGFHKLKFDNEIGNYHNFYFAPMLNTTLCHYNLNRTTFKNRIVYGISFLISYDITNKSWKNKERIIVNIDKPRSMTYGLQFFVKI